MKKKRWIILFLITIVILGVGIIFVREIKRRGVTVSEAIYFESMYGPVILIGEESPILISNNTKRNLFDNLETGQKISVVHDSIIDVWPSRTRAYAVFKRNGDETAEIPEPVMQNLIDWGWIEPEKNIDYAGWDGGCGAPILESFEDICESSDTIVKAKYIKRDKFDLNRDIFIFEVEEDFIGNVDEKQIHVYETKESSFIKGKSYYLCLSSFRSPYYPHVLYTQTWNSLRVGEIEKGDSIQYTFCYDYTLGLDKVDDISKYIKTEIVEKGIYKKTERVSLEEAVKNADAIYIIKVESVDPDHRFIAFSECRTTNTLRERYPVKNQKEISNWLVPGDARVGDKFIVLLKYNEEYQSYVADDSSEHFLYPLWSSEARYIIIQSMK